MSPAVAVSSSAPATSNDLPDVIIDTKSQREYTRGKLLGKGGFADCYEFADTQTKVVYAAKVISKNRLDAPGLKEHILEEINIHSSLGHKHIVGFNSHFEDEDNVYIILELCTRKSLLHMLCRRKVLPDAEARYFLRHLLLACEHLVEQRVIHRDLKPSNLLLNEDMQLKVADFGFAARVDYEGELKTGTPGTPYYIAPEVLAKTGHSYEADVWSLGCIVYKMLVGHPPFKSPSRKKTYALIKSNEYSVPSTVSPDASTLIQWMLHPEPAKRPSIKDIMQHDFMTKGFLPVQLPVSCLKGAPDFDALRATLVAVDRKPIAEKKDCPADQAGGCASSSPIGSHTG